MTQIAETNTAPTNVEPQEKPVEQILVVPTPNFHNLGYFSGFSTDTKYWALLEDKERQYRPRPLMEKDPSWKQLIPYVVFLQEGKIFSYFRSIKQGEARLHGKRSIGVGGHINSGDLDYRQAMMRELDEELKWYSPEHSHYDLAGFINDDSDDVGRVHFGVVHVMRVPASVVLEPADPLDMLDSGLFTIEELVADFDRCEGWTQIILKSGVLGNAPVTG